MGVGDVENYPGSAGVVGAVGAVARVGYAAGAVEEVVVVGHAEDVGGVVDMIGGVAVGGLAEAVAVTSAADV